MKQNNETIKATIKAFIDKISEVAQKNDLQLINSDGELFLQPKCYLYTEPEDTKGFVNLFEDELQYEDTTFGCKSYVIGSMDHPEKFNLLDSLEFKCITHYYYLKVKRVLHECKKLQEYMVANGISLAYYEMTDEIGYPNHSFLWHCWTPKDTPAYVAQLSVTP